MEVSLFGPGVGECVLVKLPTNKWMIIDSFVDKESGVPIALKYLQEQQLDPSNVVELILITHWHSDHIAGMSDVIAACSKATVVIPSAFTKKEFQYFICAIAKDPSLGKLNCAKEMRKVMSAIQAHYDANKIPPLYASEGQSLYKDELNKIDIVALSPSRHSLLSSVMEANDLYEKFKNENPRLHILKQAPNNNSIAVLVKVNEVSVLLGGDLVEPINNPDEFFGWSAVLKSSLITKNKSVLFKVPHHGSKTGHHDDVWADMLVDEPYSILTTYNSGKSPLPFPEDIERIKGNSGSAYLTSPPKLPKKQLRDKRLQKQIENFCRGISAKSTLTGHIKAVIDTKTGLVNIDKSTRGMIQL